MSAITRWELVAYALSALLVLSSMIVLPLARAIDPVLAVAINFESDSSIRYHAMLYADSDELSMLSRDPEPLDPWGHPWLFSPHCQSNGPDGIDSGGAGDDVMLDDVLAHPLRWCAPRLILWWPRLSLVSAGVLLALWTRVTRESLRRPRCWLALDVCSAAWIASAPTAAGWLWVILSPFDASDALGVVQLPAPVAILLSWGLLCFLIALAWRLSRPRAPEALPT